MARYRTIKPEFWTSEQVVECSTNARLLFVGLWNFCDDNGIHPHSAKRIKMEVFPGDDFSFAQIDQWLGELLSVGLLKSYVVSGEPFLAVTGWHHQRIDKPTAKFPTPDKADSPLAVSDNSESGTGDVLDRSRLSRKERKGEEKSGEERSRTKAALAAGDIAIPAEIDTPEVRDAVDRWLTHKRQIGKPYKSAETARLMFGDFPRAGPAAFVAAVNHSIGQNYQGIYAPSGSKNGNSGTASAGKEFSRDAKGDL